jgi:hypothetical protein
MSDIAHDEDLVGWFPNSHMHKESEEVGYYPTRLGSETRAMGNSPHIPRVNFHNMFRRGGSVVDHALSLTRHTALHGMQPKRGRP